ncbi:MAG: TniQ family protein [Burkholderiaceae bacterium]
MNGSTRAAEGMAKRLGMLPSWELGETLYSWASKTHLILARSARSSSNALFGSLRACRAHDVPPRLARFVELTNGRLGSAQDILAKRTVLGGHLPFLEESRRSAVVAALVAGEGARANLHLGLRASKMPSTHPLRFCETCAAEDRATLGYARWQVVHQLPAVWMCESHLTTLVEFGGVARAWELPGDRKVDAASRISAGHDETLLRMAAVCTAAHGLGVVNAGGLRRASLEKLCELGLVGNPARLSAATLHDEFCSSLAGAWVAAYEPLKHLHKDGEWVASLLRARSASHPTKWALVWAWLWADLSAAEVGISFRQAALDAATSKGQLALWPEHGREDLGASLLRVEEAMTGATTMDEVRGKVGVKHFVLSRWLKEFPHLQEFWDARQVQRRREIAVKRIEEAIVSLSDVNRQRLRELCSAEIRWLERHDRETLNRLLSRIHLERSRQRRLFGDPEVAGAIDAL